MYLEQYTTLRSAGKPEKTPALRRVRKNGFSKRRNHDINKRGATTACKNACVAHPNNRAVLKHENLLYLLRASGE
jgi:hypothetical protein